MDPSKEFTAHFEENAALLAEFLASKERLKDRLSSARTGNQELRLRIASFRREFETELELLRREVAPLIAASSSHSGIPSAPHSTPVG